MNQPEPREALYFEELEHQQNLANLDAMEQEIADRSDSLTERIARYSGQFDVPAQEFWDALDAQPRGPLAAVLATEARRQNIHHESAARHIGQLDNVEGFHELPIHGGAVRFIGDNGQIVQRNQLARREPRPSEALDFTWQTGGITCYAAQKFTREGGGNQDSRFDETIRLLRNFRQFQDRDVALFVIVDGGYYTEERLEQLQELVREDAPRSYVLGINDLQGILNQIADVQ